MLFELSKNFPTYPWNIPQTQNQQFMKEFLSFGGLGRPGVCSRGMLGPFLSVQLLEKKTSQGKRLHRRPQNDGLEHVTHEKTRG